MYSQNLNININIINFIFYIGPYVFAAGITTYVLSKEIWVVEHEFPYVLATIGLFYVGWKKFGSSLAAYLDKEIDVFILTFSEVII